MPLHDQSRLSPTDVPVCLLCGYRIDHLDVSRCPECGATFDLSDEKTYTTIGVKQHAKFGAAACVAGLSGAIVLLALLSVRLEGFVIVALMPYSIGVGLGYVMPRRTMAWVVLILAVTVLVAYYLAAAYRPASPREAGIGIIMAYVLFLFIATPLWGMAVMLIARFSASDSMDAEG